MASTKPVIFPIRFTRAQSSAIKTAARRLSLSQQDIVRLSITRGIPILEQQLAADTPPDAPAKPALISP